MNDKQKQQKTEPQRKLTLNRETLRVLEAGELRLLEGVVGGTSANSGTAHCGDVATL